GRVSFASPTTGASAVPLTASVTIADDGTASASLTANGIAGSFAVTARASGANRVDFSLANQLPVIVTHPSVTGPVSVAHTRKGVSTLTFKFSEALNPASAENPGFYSLAAAVKKRHKVLFTKPVRIRSVSYDSNVQTVTLHLARPFKGL